MSAVGRKVKNQATDSETEVSPEVKAWSGKTESENIDSRPTQKNHQTEDVSEEGGRTEACGFIVGDDASGEEETEERNNHLEESFEKEGNVNRTTSSSDSDSKKLEIVEFTAKEGQGNQHGQAGKSVDQLTPEKIEGNDMEERNDISEISTTKEEATHQLKQENGKIKSKGDEGLQISFHGATASIRVSHSSVELGRTTSSGTESNGKGSPERRRLARFLNRSTGNRAPKLNIFATAQARGRTLLPELRSKLSSFSQQVRSRSPKLNPKRPSLHSESNNQQKQLRRKCRTKIIEL